MNQESEKQGFLKWEGDTLQKSDISGFNRCRVCGDLLEIETGPDGYGDNTDQRLTCHTCGWWGTRLIRYNRSGSCRTLFSKAYLKSFKPMTKEMIGNLPLLLDLPYESGRLELYAGDEDSFCLIKTGGKVWYVNQLNDVNIQWSELIVTFNFDCTRMCQFQTTTDEIEYLSLELRFDTAHALLEKMDLYRYPAEDLKMVHSQVKKRLFQTDKIREENDMVPPSSSSNIIGSDPVKRYSTLTRWVIGFFIFYIVSPGPVLFFIVQIGHIIQLPDWVLLGYFCFYLPHAWLADHNIIYDAYVNWCFDLVGWGIINF